MVSGFYSDIELTKPTGTVTNELDEKERELEGVTKSQRVDPLYTILECHVNLDLEGIRRRWSRRRTNWNKITLRRYNRRR